MTAKLSEAIDKLSKLPADRQEELAAFIGMLADDTSRHYTPEQQRAIDEGIQDAESNRFASVDEVSKLFAKYKLA